MKTNRVSPGWIVLLISVFLSVGNTNRAQAQTAGSLPPVSNMPRTTPVGLPQDAAPHDNSTIEWWYFNAFLESQSGHHYAVVGSFFRTGLSPTKKGHYLIYSLADLDAKTTTTASILDKTNIALLKAILPLYAMRSQNSAGILQLMAAMQKNTLPPPHQSLQTDATVQKVPFKIVFGDDSLTQTTEDARTWEATLKAPDFAINLTLKQPTLPPMLVGGAGKTGLNRPDDMYYLSLTHMDATGTLQRNGQTESVQGIGWLDRQWGSSWAVGNNGWDWFGLHLSDGSDLIVYRVRDNDTHRVLRAEATLLRPDGTQIVDKAPVFTPSGAWTDPASKIIYPTEYTITLPDSGLTLAVTPAFVNQTIPVLGIGDAIWEGVVLAKGKTKNGESITGRGYRELVGYKATAATAAQKK